MLQPQEDFEVPCNSPLKLEFNRDDLDSPRGRNLTAIDNSERICRATISKSQYDVVIVGGGIHGVGMQLLIANLMPNLRTVIISPSKVLASDFFNRVDTIGQTVLRSGYEHHLAPDGLMQLSDFAKLNALELTDREIRQIELHVQTCRSIVPIDVFEGHVAYLCSEMSVGRDAVHGKVDEITQCTNAGYRVTLSDGNQLEANYVILATGASKRRSRIGREKVDPDCASAPVLVIGGGLSAAHKVLELLDYGSRVRWEVRNKVRFQCSDVSHSYFRTEGIFRFQSLPPEKRLETLQMQLTSSVMPEFIDPFVNAEGTGQLQISLDYDDAEIFSSVHWFEGYFYDKSVHQGLLGNRRLGELDLHTLEYSDAPGVFVSGWAAMEAIGPAAKNIDGVRLAADRILPIIRRKPNKAIGQYFNQSASLGSRSIGGKFQTEETS